MQEQAHKRGGIIRLVISLILLIVSIAVFLNRQYVFDNVMVWRYQPTAEMRQLVTDSSMSPQGEFVFYASHPQINDRLTFNSNCTSTGEQAVVLGCYAAQRIYLFDVTDPRLDGIKEVTAAHEMLHAVYDRLPRNEKDRINALLETQLGSVSDERIRNLIALYERTEPGEKLNELHSIFATELTELLPELETYYAHYFIDRSAVVTLSQQYEQVFSTLKEQQESLIIELNSLADQITRDSETYNRATEQFNRDVREFNNRANSGGYSTQSDFNADRNELIARQESIAATRESISASIELYNQKVKQLEAINGQAEQLNQSINSNALEPAPSI